MAFNPVEEVLDDVVSELVHVVLVVAALLAAVAVGVYAYRTNPNVRARRMGRLDPRREEGGWR